MKIELELDDKDAELFVVARTKDANVVKYSADALQKAVFDNVRGMFFETIANFEIFRATEIKKAQMQEWFKAKIQQGVKDDTSLHD